MKPQATALLLNWKRPENIVKTIASIRAQNVPIEIWLWNNNADDKTAYDVDMQINSPRNFFCWPRWLMGSLAESEFIFTLDDDLMFADENVIRDCIEFLTKEDDLIPMIGYTGVTFQGNALSYFGGKHLECMQHHNIPVNIVKGRFMFLRRAALHRINLENEPTCEDIKVSAAMGWCSVLPAVLYNRLINLTEGDEALFAQPWQRERRQLAVEKYFR
jgi:hypothetical protein